jgi:hypothetical protein
MPADTDSTKKQSRSNRASGRAAEILFSAIRHPMGVLAFKESDWDLFLRVARREGLLARIAIQIDQTGAPGRIPQQALDHMIAARAIATNHARMIRWEVDRIQFALRSIETPILLLKGAAHNVEAALTAAGWGPLKLDPYDQRYYRRWMHELPPLRHRARGTVIDVHHRILPQTSRLNPDPELLWADSTVLADTRLRVLSPEDMVLHCAVHLFHDGDLNHGLRDLIDLHDLFEHFGKNPEFWPGLASRAQVLGVARPLFYALRFTDRLLGTEIPARVLATAGAAAPTWPVKQLMDQLVDRALTPEHPDHPSTVTALARWLLYVRSHYLRMPPKLLIPHLLRKGFRKRLQPA